MIKKLTSRKFALAIVMIIVMLIVSTDKNVACGCATLIAMGYMFAEAIVDGARAVKRIYNDEVSVSKHVEAGEKDENK